MELKISTDWQEIELDLKTKIHRIGYNPDLERMLKNIQSMVTELSKMEVDARRTRKTTYTAEQIVKINQAIVTLEKWMIMAALMR